MSTKILTPKEAQHEYRQPGYERGKFALYAGTDVVDGWLNVEELLELRTKIDRAIWQDLVDRISEGEDSAVVKAAWSESLRRNGP